MQVSVFFPTYKETQFFMSFLQENYQYIKEMEKYSIDLEKEVSFLTGEASGLPIKYQPISISSNWNGSMPLQALYLYCWLAVKSSYRNKEGNPIVFVNNQIFNITFNYKTLSDTQKILVSQEGICVFSEENDIFSLFMGGSTGIFNFFNKKLQSRHVENIELQMSLINQKFNSL